MCSGKNYTDPKMLEINTLENAIYMVMIYIYYRQ